MATVEYARFAARRTPEARRRTALTLILPFELPENPAVSSPDHCGDLGRAKKMMAFLSAGKFDLHWSVGWQKLGVAQSKSSQPREAAGRAFDPSERSRGATITCSTEAIRSTREEERVDIAFVSCLFWGAHNCKL